jgi:hypothetical protein
VVQCELRIAIKLQKPILFVHETNSKHLGFAEIYDLKGNTPEDLNFLSDKIEFMGFERPKLFFSSDS